MDITRLPRKWRKEAARQPVISAGDVDTKLTLKRCADELELAWHQVAHGLTPKPGCRFCAWEREHNGNYPELGDT